MSEKPVGDKPPALHLIGYTVVLTSGTTIDGDYIGLAFALKDHEGNEVQRSNEVETWPDLPENYPARERLYMLMEAMCRYRNTGGPEFLNMWPNHVTMEDLVNSFEGLPTMEWPEEWKLWSTEVGEHVILAEQDDKKAYIRVVEDEFTEAMTEEQFLEFKTGRRTLLIDPE